ncbi:hypothetical protein NP493_618g01112 [Ridgeia piscesae]|uniref:Uncharacterized protein n=1 Tax=Ridgeia piscesae TaxID=27915 RepID=A0AAD9KUS1_RIDPI|nr:hypothetical protein NP493_618g01112 [Ridgeia piscesae]
MGFANDHTNIPHPIHWRNDPVCLANDHNSTDIHKSDLAMCNTGRLRHFRCRRRRHDGGERVRSVGGARGPAVRHGRSRPLHAAHAHRVRVAVPAPPRRHRAQGPQQVPADAGGGAGPGGFREDVGRDAARR